MSYRERIYSDYSALMQDAHNFDRARAETWGSAYDWYLRGWLPADKNAAIADLGCGWGALLHFFKARGYQNVTGVDVSAAQVAIARQTGAEVIQGSAADFAAKNPGRFDLLAALDIVEHLTRDEALQFLDACKLALKPGGRLIIQTPNADSPMVDSVRYGDVTHETCYNASSLGSLLRTCGFTAIEPRELGPPRGYSFPASMRAMMWSLARLKLIVWNRIETGHPGSGIFTRVFAVSASTQKTPPQ